jgi:hypothetical protein
MDIEINLESVLIYLTARSRHLSASDMIRFISRRLLIDPRIRYA